MAADLKNTFLTQYGNWISSDKTTAALPFKNHPQFSILIDILSRKNHHHALLGMDFSTHMQIIFLEALQQHLCSEQIPYPLQKTELLLLNLENIVLTESKKLSLKKDLKAFCEALNKTDKYIIIALKQIELFSKQSKNSEEKFLQQQIESLLTHPKCRFILIANTNVCSRHNYLEDQFIYLPLKSPTEVDILTILKQQAEELETFHRVLIPKELLSQALLLTERYLNNSHVLEKTILLLDSSAARISSLELNDAVKPIKPVLTRTTLLQVLSDWTQIPVSHLQMNQFKQHEFAQNLEQRVFGQDVAISNITHELLQAHLEKKTGPFSVFLFAGPAYAGKKTMALALTEQLFKQLNMFFYAHPTVNGHLTEMKLQRHTDKQLLSLDTIIQQTPYAVIMFENIEKLTPSLIEGLQEIITTGLLHDINGKEYNFRQTIIILSTTVGAHSLSEFAEMFTPDEDIYTMDLLQLVMHEQKQEKHQTISSHSSQDLIDKILPHMTESFPSLYRHIHIIPFLPLNKTAVEKIIRLKLKTLGKQLHIRYGIELGYAPEIIRYLINDILIKNETDKRILNPDKAFNQIHCCIEQAILNQAENNHSNQLFLQLNETGQLLRCDWITMPSMRQHAH